RPPRAVVVPHRHHGLGPRAPLHVALVGPVLPGEVDVAAGRSGPAAADRHGGIALIHGRDGVRASAAVRDVARRDHVDQPGGTVVAADGEGRPAAPVFVVGPVVESGLAAAPRERKLAGAVMTDLDVSVEADPPAAL